MSEYDNAPVDLDQWAEEHYVHVNWKTALSVVNSFLMFGLGVNFYDNYYNLVKYDNRIINRNPIRANEEYADKEWAWASKEISAWTNYSYASMAAYGSNALLWILNYYYDGEGGQIHHAYYRSSQMNHYFAPLALVLLFGRVFNAYNRTVSSSEEEFDDTCDDDECLAAEHFFFKHFDWDNTPPDNDDGYAVYKNRVLKDEYQQDFAVAALSIFFSVWVQGMSLGAVRQHYEDCAAQAELGDEEPAADEEHDEAAEEEEENFETWF